MIPDDDKSISLSLSLSLIIVVLHVLLLIKCDVLLDCHDHILHTNSNHSDVI